MKILSRYVLREHIAPFVAALVVLTSMMLLNQLAKRLGTLVGKGLPWHVIAEVFGLSVPFIVAMTMPMAVLVAVLYTFSRLSIDNEVTAIKAGGVSLFRLMVPVLLASVALASGMIWFNDNVLPDSNHALRKLLSDIGRKRPTFELRERVVNEVVPGELFLQAARIDRARSVLWDLVIFDLGRGDVERTIYADSGHMAFNPTQTDLYLTLYDGSMHELDSEDPGTDQRTHYTKQVIRVSGVTNELERGQSADWRGDREMTIAMMQDEVRSRHEQLRTLDDSTSGLIAALRPAGYASPEDASAHPRSPRVPKTAPEPGAASGANQARVPQPLARVGTAGPIKGATERQRRSRPQRRDRGGILPGSRRAAWPPVGDPAAFASRTRAEFQRIASRRDIHRREMSRLKVEIHKKFAIPVAAIVFVLIGAPIGIRFPRGGIGMVIGVSLAVFCVYYVFLIGGEELADRTIISPFWAMWAPNALFAAAGGGILYLVSRSGAKRDQGSVYKIVNRLRPRRAALHPPTGSRSAAQ